MSKHRNKCTNTCNCSMDPDPCRGNMGMGMGMGMGMMSMIPMEGHCMQTPQGPCCMIHPQGMMAPVPTPYR